MPAAACVSTPGTVGATSRGRPTRTRAQPRHHRAGFQRRKVRPVRPVSRTGPAAAHDHPERSARDDPRHPRRRTRFDICVEAHGKFNTASAGRIIKMLEPFDPFFLEEPVPPENVDAMAALQRSTNIPIATGEGIQIHISISARFWANRPRASFSPTPRARRDHRDEKNRGDGGDALRHYRAPQSERSGLFRGEHARRRRRSRTS